MGLDPAWSLDLSCEDLGDGSIGDLSKPEKRQKARDMLRRDKPELLVACPMCGPFSSWMHINYGKVTDEEARKKLQEGLDHLRFSLELWYGQHREGRLFLFEHPVAATSWGTRMMAEMKKLDGVYAVNFDFCVLGMNR